MAEQKLIYLLYELMKDSKRSDREFAKAIGVSQPTITRMRKNLENLGYIREYTVIPALEKIGFEILALNFLSANLTPEFNDWISKNPKIIFAGTGEGAEGNTLLLASIHKDFTDFSEFISEIRKLFASNVQSLKSFLSSLKVDVVKPFSLRNLERIQPKPSK